MKITKTQLRRIIIKTARANLVETYNKDDKLQYSTKIESLLDEKTVDAYRIAFSFIDAMADKDPGFANQLVAQMSRMGMVFQRELTKKADLLYHGPRNPDEKHAWRKARSYPQLSAKQLIKQDQLQVEDLSSEMEELSQILSDAMDLTIKLQEELTGKPFKQGGKSNRDLRGKK